MLIKKKMRKVEGNLLNKNLKELAVLLNMNSNLNVLSVTLEWAATASSAKAVSTGCIRSAVGSSA